MRGSRGVGRTLVAGVLCAVASAGTAADSNRSGELVLRRAELVRNPFVGTAVEVELSVVSRATGRPLRESRFVLITQRGEATLVLLATGEPGAPGALLFADDAYWLLMPHAEQPVELAMRHVVAGELSHVGFLRVDLRTRYRPREIGVETVDGESCWRLELEPRRQPAPFGRVRYWVTRDQLLPRRIDFHDPAGTRLKVASFVAYRATGAGLRPSRIEIEDAQRPDERAILTLGNPRTVPTAGLRFDPFALVALREAARRLAAEGDETPNGARLVAALSRLSAARPPSPPASPAPLLPSPPPPPG